MRKTTLNIQKKNNSLIKKLFKIKKRQIVSFKSKSGKKIIKTYKQNYIIFLNYKKHFQKNVKPIQINFFDLFIKTLKDKYHSKIKKIKNYNQRINSNFIYNFLKNKNNVVQQLFIKTYYLFFQQIQQASYLINTFPKFFLNLVSFDRANLKKYVKLFTCKSLNNYNKNDLKKLQKFFKKILKHKNASYINKFLSNKIFFSYINKITEKILKKPQSQIKTIFTFKKWIHNYQKYLKNKFYNSLNVKQRKKQEYATNFRLLKDQFQNNLTSFLAHKKAQELAFRLKNPKKFMKSNYLLYRLKTKFYSAKKNILRNIYLYPINNFYKKKLNTINSPLFYFNSKTVDLLTIMKTQYPKNINNFQKINIKLSFLSKRLLNIFISSISKIKFNKNYKISNKLNVLNSYLLNIYQKYKIFAFNKVKTNILFIKKLTIIPNFQSQLNNINILKNKTLLVKARFNKYMFSNILYNKMYLMQNLNVTDLLQNTSDILRAEHFRNIINKEQAYYDVFYKQQNPLHLLTTITGHNIYLTLFISKPYNILWKASAGMLGLKNFRRAKKHQMTFKDLLIRCQLFLARNRILLRRPLHLLLRYLNYFGTKNFLSFFITNQKSKTNFDNYKNYKIYNFYKNAKHLCNNYALQFMSMIWSRVKNNYVHLYRKTFHNLININKTKIKAFPDLLKKKSLTSSFVVLNKDPRLKKFLNKNPFLIK